MEATGSPTAEPAVTRLANALLTAVRRCALGTRGLTVLYSGGLDSSLVAYLARRWAPVQLIVLGAEGARDPAAARLGAQRLGLPISQRTVTAGEIRELIQRRPEAFDRCREPLRSVRVALALGLEGVPKGRVLLGQGADELFFGYAHFRGLSDAAARDRRTEDLHLLVRREWPWTDEFARRCGVDARAPFLEPEVVQAAEMLPPPPAGAPPKHFLRRAAIELGVPTELATAPKRALQYGSGVRRLLARVDRSVGAPLSGSTGTSSVRTGCRSPREAPDRSTGCP